METKKNIYVWRTVASFLLVLFAMPLGHALMILMEKLMSEGAMHVAGFLMGLVGLVMVIVGVFVKGDTRQTLWGLFGGLLFWTGWVEFLFLYYARRYGVQPEMENGVVVTKPEYLILPASFGMWMMTMVMYIFSTKNGCDFITWIQKVCFRDKRKAIVVQPMTRHTSIVTFMELNMMLWALYLLLMFCYDKNFLGDHHPVTYLVGIGCFIGSLFMLRRQLHIAARQVHRHHHHAVLEALQVALAVEGLERVRRVVLEGAQERGEAELVGVGLLVEGLDVLHRVLVQDVPLVVALLHQVVQLLLQVVEEHRVLVDVLEEVLACSRTIRVELDAPVRVVQVELRVQRVVVQLR